MAKITDYIIQDGNDLIAKQNLTLTIDLLNYVLKDSLLINEDEGFVWLKSLISRVEFSDIIFNLILDYSVKIQLTNNYQKTKEIISIKYEKNDVILNVDTEASEMKGQIKYVERLIIGKEIFKDELHLLKKLLAVYGPMSPDMDLVHLEVLCSQVLRDKNNIQIPARLGKTWDPILINMKKVVFSEGFIQGLAFENINEALQMGLISEAKEDTNIIEKVLTGKLQEEL